MCDAKTKSDLGRLRALPPSGLRAEYARVFGRCDPRLGEVFMRRRISYHLQAMSGGDFSPAQKMMFFRIAQRDRHVNPSAAPTKRPPLPIRGVTYVREYKGRTYEAKATGCNQFELEGKVYPSLTACVLAITGQHYSGRKWFRLKGAV